MAKKNHSDKIHVYYTPEFVAHWEEQPQVFKDQCDVFGEANGYSGMNVFYMFLLKYLSSRMTKQPYRPMIRS